MNEADLKKLKVPELKVRPGRPDPGVLALMRSHLAGAAQNGGQDGQRQER